MQSIVNAQQLRLQQREDLSLCSPPSTNQDLDEAIGHLQAIAALWRELRADLSRADPMSILAGPGADMDRLVGLAEEFVHARNGHSGALV